MWGLIFMAGLLAVAVLRDWRFWPALVAWAIILFAALLVPNGAPFEGAGDSQTLWLLAGAFAFVMGVREYVNARLRHASHKAR